jgi:hypothetical protein
MLVILTLGEVEGEESPHLLLPLPVLVIPQRSEGTCFVLHRRPERREKSPYFADLPAR